VNSIDVKKAGVEDAGAIFSIQEECELSPWPRAAYEAEVTRSDAIVLVASTETGRAIGFITGRVIPAGSGSVSHAEIYNLGVLSEYRSQGIGTALVVRFVDICRRFSVAQVFLEVRHSNQAAIGFYAAHGFRTTGIRRNFYTNPIEDAAIMALSVAGRFTA
jgi:ribosomal-protein-alanine acetyltransferase